jgi:hypothetical protein
MEAVRQNYVAKRRSDAISFPLVGAQAVFAEVLNLLQPFSHSRVVEPQEGRWLAGLRLLLTCPGRWPGHFFARPNHDWSARLMSH